MLAELNRPGVLFGSTECSTCRMQMQEGSGKRTLHPVQYLAYRLRPHARDRREAEEAAWEPGERLMHLTVILFAAARELAGAESIAVELPPGATVADLRTELARRVPALAGLLAKSALAVNHDFAESDRSFSRPMKSR